ncbi:MAG TPA: hypothetical protein VGB17_14465 [Pyrinomonadaceae bacterium]|jgi:hypothetical protein
MTALHANITSSLAAVCVCLLIIGTGASVVYAQPGAEPGAAGETSAGMSARVNTKPSQGWAVDVQRLMKRGQLKATGPVEVAFEADTEDARRLARTVISKSLLVASNGREIIFDLEMPREVLCALISKQLASE